MNNSHIPSSLSKKWLDLFVFSLLAYDTLGYITNGPIISILRWTLLAWFILAFIKNLLSVHKSPILIKMLTILFILFLAYGLLVILDKKNFTAWRTTDRTIRSFTYILQISFSLLPIIVFYHFGKIGVLTKNYMIRRIPIFLLVIFCCYYLAGQVRMEFKEAEEITNNSGYLVLSIIPMFMFLKNRSLKQYLCWAFCLGLILYSMKRGAIIISILLIGIFFLYLFRKSKRSKILNIFFALIIALVGAYYSFEEMMSSSEYFQTRVDKTMEGNSSGRDVIYTFFWEYYISETTPKEFLVGMGANATLDIFGQYAHNDWLEIAINQGLLGLVVYLLFWISFLWICLKKNVPPDVRVVLWMLLTIYFFKSIFSMSYREFTIYSSMILGYCIAVINYQDSFLYPRKKVGALLKKIR